MDITGSKDNILLISYLNEYVRMNKPQFAVMITGKWGCGKTFFIDELIRSWEKEKVKTDPNSIRLKPISVSVYGLHSIDEVVRQIKFKLNPILYSKGAKIAKNVALTTLQILTKSKVDIDRDGTGEDLKNLLDAEGVLEVFKSDSTSLKGLKILVFDDLERSRIPLDEFFGFVNNIVEHSNSKVILICDEEKLIESAEKDQLKVEYKSFKEKLVGHTFSLKVNHKQITGEFISASKNRILIENRDLIVDLFTASECENLRIIKHAFLDIERFFQQLPAGIKEDHNYALFEKNVVAYLVITSIEERIGNKSIDSFQSSGVFSDARDASQIDLKYNRILKRYQLYQSAFVIPIPTLLTFIRKGYLDDPERVAAGCRVLQSRNLSNWEKLWCYQNLSNEEFIRLLTKEKTRFYNKELEYAFEVAHLAGILLSLETHGLIKLSRRRVVGVAKANIKLIYQKNPEDLSRVEMSRHGYEYQESNSEEMQEIMSFSSSLLLKRRTKIEKEYVIKAWQKLGAGIKESDIEVLFEQLTPTHHSSYSYGSLFTQIRPQVMADKILELPNETKMEFSYFLENRYYLEGSRIQGELTDGMKLDRAPLMRVLSILKSKAQRLRLVDKEVTLRVVSKMEEAVSKM